MLCLMTSWNMIVSKFEKIIVEYLEAYDQGYEAFGTWMDFTDNPYPKGSDKHRGWGDGFCDAEYSAG